MPVTARLSQKFDEKFGDDITNELVDWFNKVDTTYRAELRDLNDLNFARFDAKLEQRSAALEAKLEKRSAELEAKLEHRVSQLEAKIEQWRAELHAEFQIGLASLEGRLLGRMGVLEGRFGILEGRLIRWMFLFWAASLGTVLAVR